MFTFHSLAHSIITTITQSFTMLRVIVYGLLCYVKRLGWVLIVYSQPRRLYVAKPPFGVNRALSCSLFIATTTTVKTLPVVRHTTNTLRISWFCSWSGSRQNTFGGPYVPHTVVSKADGHMFCMVTNTKYLAFDRMNEWIVALDTLHSTDIICMIRMAPSNPLQM